MATGMDMATDMVIQKMIKSTHGGKVYLIRSKLLVSTQEAPLHGKRSNMLIFHFDLQRYIKNV